MLLAHLGQPGTFKSMDVLRFLSEKKEALTSKLEQTTHTWHLFETVQPTDNIPEFPAEQLPEFLGIIHHALSCIVIPEGPLDSFLSVGPPNRHSVLAALRAMSNVEAKLLVAELWISMYYPWSLSFAVKFYTEESFPAEDIQAQHRLKLVYCHLSDWLRWARKDFPHTVSSPAFVREHQKKHAILDESDPRQGSPEEPSMSTNELGTAYHVQQRGTFRRGFLHVFR